MHYASEQPALNPSASQNPLSASELWNLVADAQTLPNADAALSLFGLMFFPDRQKGFAEIYHPLKPGGSIAEFWGHMVKGRVPIQMMKRLGEALWREKEKLAHAGPEETRPALNRPPTSDV